MPGNDFRLGELAKMAGIAKKTIHYYLSIGILPPPKKIHGRLSLYDANHVKLVKLVQRLQTDKKLPLSFIAQLFKQGGYDADTLELGLIADSYEKMIDGVSLLNTDAKNTKAPHITRIGVKAHKELKILGIVESETKTLTVDEMKVGALLEKAAMLTIPFEAFQKIQALVDQMIMIESGAIIQSIDGDSSYSEVIHRLATIDDIFNAYIRKSKSILLRKHYEEIYVHAPFSINKLYERLYIPSHAFLKKHKISESLASLEQKVKKDDRLIDNSLHLIEGYMATGSYVQSLDVANRVLKKSSENIDALVLAAGAQALLGNTDEAIVFSEMAITLDPENAKAAAYHGMICIVQASRVGGIISPGKWLNKALASFRLSVNLPSTSDRDLVDVLLMKGRAFTIMPPNLGMIDEGIKALHKLETIISNHSDSQFGWAFSGFNAILCNNINFYLGEAFSLKGDATKMIKHWERVILSDPTSNFGKMAYERIS